ncbi:hypothetical protein HYPSUDRAFT_80850 [Hypholoma sublateritium FD-334 SS-4]|uniref:Aminopeptidase n=1 Tax=Hypholoma sublateritium (strain FD-334 SS-4) TaxID=945553 RepID=A0A0D2N5B8_HYPSF|nr:hypothetical protein HYPSUDRAFT_80850 [Hypholoma sublateritium FD-334 SS-4]
MPGYTTTVNVIFTGHQAQFVLDVTAACLPLYEEVFKVEYPLPKLDTLLAHDFEGAMEHWGLITGATQILLIDLIKSTQQEKVSVFHIQCHEIAHMWFGNITTMKWWDTLYLNEGFATLMGELIIPDRIHPEWRAGSEFVVGHFNRALNLDAKLSSHPVEVECPDANRINEMFDDLSYSKAGSVLRMLSHYVGADKFLEGVSLYLKAHLFGNAVTHDLWQGISAATGIDIAELMDDWITKIGYPVLTVTENVAGIHVRQDRFLETGPADPKDNETIWNIPLSLLSTEHGISSVDKAMVLREREATFVVDTTKPFKLNTGTKGVYRVLYTPKRLAKIATEAAQPKSVFSLDDRTGLLQDAFALSKAGFSTPSSSLTVVDLWRSEKEYVVWEGMAAGLDELVSIWWEDASVVENLKRFQRTLFVPLVERLGYEYSENDSRDRILLRTLAITQAAAADDKGVLQVLQAKFKRFLKTGNNSHIPAELQQVTYAVAVKFGGRVEYDTIVKIFELRRTPSEQKAASFAMGASQDLEIIHETTEFIVNKARDQDLIPLFAALSANFASRRAATQTFMQNYDTFYNRYKDQLSLGVLVSACLNYYSSQADYQAIETYFKVKDTSKYSHALAQSLDGIKARSAYVERATADILDWFHKNI